LGIKELNELRIFNLNNLNLIGKINYNNCIQSLYSNYLGFDSIIIALYSKAVNSSEVKKMYASPFLLHSYSCHNGDMFLNCTILMVHNHEIEGGNDTTWNMGWHNFLLHFNTNTELINSYAFSKAIKDYLFLFATPPGIVNNTNVIINIRPFGNAESVPPYHFISLLTMKDDSLVIDSILPNIIPKNFFLDYKYYYFRYRYKFLAIGGKKLISFYNAPYLFELSNKNNYCYWNPASFDRNIWDDSMLEVNCFLMEIGSTIYQNHIAFIVYDNGTAFFLVSSIVGKDKITMKLPKNVNEYTICSISNKCIYYVDINKRPLTLVAYKYIN